MTDQAVSAASDPEKIVEEVKAAPRRLQPLRRLLPFLLRYPLRLTLTILFLLVSAISSLAIPAVLADAILGIVCLILAAKKGRLGELKQKQVTPRNDPAGPQPCYEYKEKKAVDNDTSEWHYTDEMK